MPRTPEDRAREEIDGQLESAGWIVQDMSVLNIAAGRGVAVREFPLGTYGAADYLLYVDRKAAGIIEAKSEGTTLTGVETQSEKYSVGLAANLPAWRRPLPFLYESTGAETQFTNLLDPDPRSRIVFSFHRPETLATWARGLSGVAVADDRVREPQAEYNTNSTLLTRLRGMPPLEVKGMRDAQIKAIRNLEHSLADNRPRALVQMTGGAGKTYTAVAQCYRLIKYAGAKRILFLVDRSNLARQTLKEFQQYDTPDDGRKFTELYNVQHLKSNTIDPVSRVVITTIQRLYSILKGEPEFDESMEEVSAFDVAPTLRPEPIPVVYNPAIPIETFDFVITDECHRSIYNLWRQALEYFDAYLIGLTATPSKQTFGYFNQNLVMEYTRAEAVADGVCVDFDVYRIRTKITESGSTVDAGLYVDKRHKRSRRVRWEQLGEDFVYTADELDRSVVAVDQIRTVIRTFKDKLFTEIFPGRTEVPKTLVFAKDDSHAEDIVRMVREEFNRGKDFCRKITYRSNTAKIVEKVTGADGIEQELVTYKNNGIKAEDLLSEFRNSYHPRIAVTVDMIATGTDVKPLEIVFFMRDVKSGNYFEQMNMRGSRTLPPDEFHGVTSDSPAKTRYVIVDAVGVCEREHSESLSLERQPHVPFKRLLQVVGMGSTEPDVVSTLVSRLSRLDRQLSPQQREYVESCAGSSLKDMVGRLVASLDDDAHEDLAMGLFAVDAPQEAQIAEVAEGARAEALAPFLNAELRNRLMAVQQETEQTIDSASVDTLIAAEPSEVAAERARNTTISFRQFIQDNRDEITALQILYSRPYGKSPTLKQLRELAAEIQRPPRQWTTETLWRAYQSLEKSRVHGSGGRMLTDLVSLVRFALEQETILQPFAETVEDRFARWLSEQESAGRAFTNEQKRWLEMIRDHIATSLAMDTESFDLTPFSDQGGLGKAYALFGEQLVPLVDELNGALAA
jgi:type I restriction enzyme R subunit